MLVDAERAASFFGDEGGATLGAEEFKDTYAEKEGDVIGPYKLRQQIGEGGFGTVWMAEQSVPISRMVALKVIKAGMDTKQVLARFEAERQAVAMMDHPHIAKVLDAGATPTGRPYFAMELVKGIPITDYCDQAGFGTKERLALFRDVCSAINHAHQKGIIHRDIKPSNVMVTLHGDKPVVKVIDFGIAKATQGKLTDQTLFTRFEQFIGTPVYMSPEQASLSGLDIDTRSDIYALGILLYEMLVGKPPFDAKSLVSAGYEEMRRIIREVEPVKPSSRLGTIVGEERTLLAKAHRIEEGKLGKLVEPDLDWIVMKAIEKDRTRRYETANAFAQDIVRFLADEAVTARPPSAGYQFRKFARRNKAAFRLAALIAAVLVAATVVSTWQAVRATKAEALAAEEEQRAVAGEQKATAAEAVAKDAQAAAVQERETARQALAKSQLDLAEKHFERGNFVESQKILDETPENFRDANWRFLQAHSRDFTAELPVGAAKLRFLPRGNRFVAKTFYGKIGVFTLEGRQIGSWIKCPRTADESIAIDTAGTRIAFSPAPKEIVVQEIATGNLLSRWTIEGDQVHQIVMSPDGETVLAASGSRLTAYDTPTGKIRWAQPSVGAQSAFTPDGQMVAVLTAKAGLSLTVRIVEAHSGSVLKTLEALADNPEKSALQFNQAGDQLACLGGDEVILWDPRTAKRIRTFHFPSEKVRCLSPTGEVLATTGGNRIRLWETATGRLLRSLNGAEQPAYIDFSPDGRILLSVHKRGLVRVWPIRLDEEIARARPSKGGPVGVAFDIKGSSFYAIAGHQIGSWENGSSLQKWTHSTEGLHVFLDLAIHPTDGSILVSNYESTRLLRLSSQGEVLGSITCPRFSHFGFSSDGRFVAVTSVKCRVLAYPSGQVLQELTFPGLKGSPMVAFCLDDTSVAVAGVPNATGESGGITVWDWKANRLLYQMDPAATGSINGLAASRDGRFLASCGPDRWIRIWEAATGELKSAFRADWEEVHCVKFSADGREVLSGSELGTVRIHKAFSGEEVLAFYGLADPVRDVDFSPDGNSIAAISKDGMTKVWNRTLSSEAALFPKGKNVWEKTVTKELPEWQAALRKAEITPKALRHLGDGTWEVDLEDSAITDLTLLRGAQISRLNLKGTVVSDLTPLRGMGITRLVLDQTAVIDLSPLKGMPLSELHLAGTKITDISDLVGLPLTSVGLQGCAALAELSPLENCQALKEVTLPPKATDFEFLRRLPNIERVSFEHDPLHGFRPAQTVAEFWLKHPEVAWQRALRSKGGVINEVRQLPDGTWRLNIEGSGISDLTPLRGVPLSVLFVDKSVSDLEPLKGMPLKQLLLRNSQVTDLRPLEGMPIAKLDLANTRIVDLGVLPTLALTELKLPGCDKLVDLSPLAECKTLINLVLPPNPGDIEILRGHPKLKRIGFKIYCRASGFVEKRSFL